MRQCSESDRARILAYIAREPEMNLFVYGDIENFGVCGGPVEVFVQERASAGQTPRLPGAADAAACPGAGLRGMADGPAGAAREQRLSAGAGACGAAGSPAASAAWDCLVLRYFDNYIVYSPDDGYDAAAAAAFLQGRTVECISGKTSVIAPLAPLFPRAVLRPTTLSRCSTAPAPVPLAAGAQVRRLTQADVPAVIALFCSVEEFADTYRGREEKAAREMCANLAQGGMAAGVFCGGVLAACAATSAGSTQSAMVVGVAAHPDWRGRGFATAALTEVCRAAFAQGVQFLCLFYDNPAAGRIYAKAGFVPVGSYAMLR